MSNKRKGKFGKANHPKHFILKEIKLISRKIMKLELQYQFAISDERAVDAHRILRKAESLNARLAHLKAVLSPVGDKPAEKPVERVEDNGNPNNAVQ